MHKQKWIDLKRAQYFAQRKGDFGLPPDAILTKFHLWLPFTMEGKRT